MEARMPMNRFTLALASIALGSLSAQAQAPSGAANAPPASPTASSAAAAPFITGLRAGMWRASKLDGVNVYNNANEKVGDISDVLFDQSGRIEAIVIGVGGFLGLGERNVAVPFDQIRWSNEPIRSVSSTPAPSGGGTGARLDTPDRSDVTGAIRSTTGDMAMRGYPDHAVVNMSREQVRSAPQFKY